jgi:hypothetical protein
METLGTVLGWMIVKYIVDPDGNKTMYMYNRSTGFWSAYFTKESMFVSIQDAQKVLFDFS